MILLGRIVTGAGHARQRMARYPRVFLNATGEVLVEGTLNVNVGRNVPVREDFRIRGSEIDEPGQDLLFEACRINGIPAYRIRPYVLTTGEGGHGDHILEIACCQIIKHKGWAEIELWGGIER